MTIIELKQSLKTIWLLVLDKNTWNYSTVFKLFALGRSTLYQLTVQKYSWKITTQKSKYIYVQ